MIAFRAVVSKLKKASKAGVSIQKLSLEYGVSKPEIGRIIKGHYPGPKIAQILGLRPKCPTCHRSIIKKTIKQPAPKIGRDEGWLSYYMRRIGDGR
jgi:lambda repressor-like predicted transcriptional regulator